MISMIGTTAEDVGASSRVVGRGNRQPVSGTTQLSNGWHPHPRASLFATTSRSMQATALALIGLDSVSTGYHCTDRCQQHTYSRSRRWSTAPPRSVAGCAGSVARKARYERAMTSSSPVQVVADGRASVKPAPISRTERIG